MLKVIVAGGRDFEFMSEHLDYVAYKIRNYYNIKTMTPLNGGIELVTGCARGADQIPEFFHAWHGTPIKRFPADWDKHGKSAGYIRNTEMAYYSDALIAFWDGKSRGTGHMIDIARRQDLKISIVNY